MKKFFKLALATTAILSVVTPAFAAKTKAPAEYIGVIVNGKAIFPAQKPIMENGHTLVPMRSIFDAMGAEVKYDAATKTITATKGNSTVQLTLNSTEALVNGKMYSLELPASSMDGTTMVPLRFVGEALGAKVKWHGGERVIRVASPEYEYTLDITDKYTDTDFDYQHELGRIQVSSMAGLKSVLNKDGTDVVVSRAPSDHYNEVPFTSSQRDAILGALDVPKEEVQDLVCRMIANYYKTSQFRLQMMYLLALLTSDNADSIIDPGTISHVQAFMRDKLINGDSRLSKTENDTMRRHIIIALCNVKDIVPQAVDSVLTVFETSDNNFVLSPVPVFLKLHRDEILKMPDIEKYRARLAAVNNLNAEEARAALR